MHLSSVIVVNRIFCSRFVYSSQNTRSMLVTLELVNRLKICLRVIATRSLYLRSLGHNNWKFDANLVNAFWGIDRPNFRQKSLEKRNVGIACFTLALAMHLQCTQTGKRGIPCSLKQLKHPRVLRYNMRSWPVALKLLACFTSSSIRSYHF